MYSKCDQKINYDNLKCSEMNKSPCIIQLIFLNLLLHLLHSYGTYQTVLKIQNLSLCYLFLGVSRLILSPKSALNLKKENAISFLAKNLILILIILCHIGSIPAFRPRFAGKCDDTTLLVVTISRLNQLLITPSPS